MTAELSPPEQISFIAAISRRFGPGIAGYRFTRMGGEDCEIWRCVDLETGSYIEGYFRGPTRRLHVEFEYEERQ